MIQLSLLFLPLYVLPVVQIRLVFEEKPYSFLAFSLFSAFAGGHLGAVLLEMLIKLSTQVGKAGGRLSGTDMETVSLSML